MAIDRRIIKTKKAIQEAYFQLLLDPRVKKVTVAEIARIADIDRKTFYLHYETIDDVLKEYHKDKINTLVQVLTENGYYEDITNFELLFKVFNDFIKQDYVFYHHIASREEYDFIWKGAYQEIVNTALKKFGPISRLPERELKLFLGYFVSGMIITYRNWLIDSNGVSEEELIDYIATITESTFKAAVKESIQK